MYQKRTNKETKESAVSPVVGVMLMLVVTIVIAAVVTLFATGMVGDTTVAPTVSTAADINTEDSTITFSFVSVSEPIAMSDVQFNLKSTKYIENNTGDGIVPEYRLYQQSGALGDSGVINSGLSVVKVLALVNPANITTTDVTIANAMSSDDNLKKYFELYTVENTSDNTRFDLYAVIGGKITSLRYNVTDKDATINTMTKIQDKNNEHPDRITDVKGQFATCNPSYSFVKNVNLIQINELENLEAGDKVDVELVHIPSNSVIYAKTIVVGA